MINLVDISKAYKGIDLFDQISCEFPLGKKILIKGPNGSGKSVLLKMIVGYSLPDSGQVLIDQEVLGEKRDFIPNAGVSINAPEFQSDLTGLENLLELAKIRKVTSKKEILELAKDLKLNNLNKKYKYYSLGMKQKMRIIQAIMDHPKYLILDEPFDALDQESQEITRNLLKDYITEDKLLIFTCHNIEYEDFADIIYEINNYKVQRIK